MRTFYLGIPKPAWLADPRLADVAVFVSRTTLQQRRRLPAAASRYAIDSGAFTELQRHGAWTITAQQYARFLYRCWLEIGAFEFAASMDLMCEPAVIHGGTMGRTRFAGTRLSVAEHQRHTVDNYCQLRDLAPELPIIPVVQGWTIDEYLACIETYQAAGVDLTTVPLVGVGSICRRQATAEAVQILAALRGAGLHSLHGFGIKTTGLRRCWQLLESADSMAWSMHGRFRRSLHASAVPAWDPASI